VVVGGIDFVKRVTVAVGDSREEREIGLVVGKLRAAAGRLALVHF
jgi:hypothetical protein